MKGIRSVDAERAVRETEVWWQRWASRCSYRGPWREAVVRSAITLKALTYGPTGGIVAAPTTSLPEWIGGVRNWDYRYCWLRDATFTLYSLTMSGYREEASAFRDWLLRAVGGDPAKLQIMYGVAGERQLLEREAPWLTGYEGSRPVRIGNAAVSQVQLDVFGEVMDTLHQARRTGTEENADAWSLQCELMTYLEGQWQKPDEGIWETRGKPRQFTYSKVMAWVAFDRAVKACEHFDLAGPVARWRAVRASIHDEVCRRGYNPQRRAFTQSYESQALDASLLLIPVVGFLPPQDPRVRSTVDTIVRELSHKGFVRRYDTRAESDGLPEGEGMFLACSFWLAQAQALMGDRESALHNFEQLLGLRNDLGLLSEQYDPDAGRLLGNFPQAFSHVGLINTAHALTTTSVSPAEHRRHS